MIISAVLIEGKGVAPKQVKVEIGASELILDVLGRQFQDIPFSSLLHRGDDRGVVRFGRRGRPGWEIRASGQAAQELRALVPTPMARVSRVAALGYHAWPIWGALLALAVVQIPADWAASLTPTRLEHRMLPPGIYDGEDRCGSAGGEAAIRRFISRFDPKLGNAVRIEAVRSESFILTALPDRRLLITDAVLTNTTGDELAALLSHQIAHLKHGDAVEAVYRARGPVEIFGHLIFGPEDEVEGPLLKFSRDQERLADAAAIGMMVAAGMSQKSGADLFMRLDAGGALGQSFGPEQSSLHPGPSARAFDWHQSAKLNPGHGPAFTEQEAAALRGFCEPPPRD